jgi:hypothetical protein
MRTALLFISILVCSNSFSQKNDYIVISNGDTLWGRIKLKNKMFHIINQDTVSISAGEVRKIKSDNYKGSTVVPCKLVTYTDDLQFLDLYFVKNEATDTVMILDEIMTTPKINLYYGVSNFRTPYYFYKTPADSLPIQLIIKFQLQGGMSNTVLEGNTFGGYTSSSVNIVEDKAYANQLYSIMGDCKKIPEGMWSLLKYRDYSFKQLIKRYNKCK